MVPISMKHAHGSILLELDPIGTTLTPGRKLLKLESAYNEVDVEIPLFTIDVGDCDHFETEPLSIHLPLPPTYVQLNLHLTFDETYHSPYLVNADQDDKLYTIRMNWMGRVTWRQRHGVDLV
jgi:hypothetical protein